MANLERDWRSLGCKSGTETTHYDDDLTGLGLRCRASGGTSWTFEYRLVKGGQKYRVVYGAAGDTPPALTFAQARNEYLKDIGEDGLGRKRKVEIDGRIVEQDDPIDPRERRRKAVAPPPVGTIREALDLFFAAKLGEQAKRKKDGLPLGEKGKADKRSRLERHLGKPHGKRQLTGFTRRDVAAMLDASARKGHEGATKLLQRELGAFFRWCVGRDYIAANPMPVDEQWGSLRSRDRWLSDGELAALVKAVCADGYPFQHAYSLLLLTGLRKTEVLEARWSEVRWAEKRWVIPRERTKNRMGHVLPLSDLALAVLADARKHPSGAYILTTRRDGSPLQALGAAWDARAKRIPGADSAQARIVARAERELGEPMQPWKTHDLRRTMRSHLTALGVRREIAEAVLNHAPGGLVGTYDRYFPEAEMRAALTVWADKLAFLGMTVEPPALPAPLLRLPAPAVTAPMVEAAGC